MRDFENVQIENNYFSLPLSMFELHFSYFLGSLRVRLFRVLLPIMWGIVTRFNPWSFPCTFTAKWFGAQPLPPEYFSVYVPDYNMLQRIIILVYFYLSRRIFRWTMQIYFIVYVSASKAHIILYRRTNRSSRKPAVYLLEAVFPVHVEI